MPRLFSVAVMLGSGLLFATPAHAQERPHAPGTTAVVARHHHKHHAHHHHHHHKSAPGNATRL